MPTAKPRRPAGGGCASALGLLLSAGLLLGPACAPGHRLHPRAAEEIARGYQHLAAGDLERADVAFAHALEFGAANPEALNGAGIVERRRGRIEAARGFFEEAVRVAPDFAEGQVNLGEAELARGRPAEAEERFRAALRIDPDLLPARLDLARTLLHRGRAEPERRAELWERARREYLHVLETRPELAEAHHDLGYMDHETGLHERAERSYRRAVEAEPTYPEALHGLCVSLARMGRCAEAAAACRRCLSEAPSADRCRLSLRGALACSP